MLRGLFVTGTDTAVGKTVVSAALLHRYRAHVPLRYWKPIQTGSEQDDDAAEVARLAAASPAEIFTSGMRLPSPVSPHLAAKLSGCSIDVQRLVGAVGSEPDRARWIVEGAGGALVPINDSETMADLMRGLGLAVVVVTRTGLGTINHTLLTLEALRRRLLPVAGVVMVGLGDADNREAIERYGRVDVVGEMPRFDPLTRDRLASWAAQELDPTNHLLEFLR